MGTSLQHRIFRNINFIGVFSWEREPYGPCSCSNKCALKETCISFLCTSHGHGFSHGASIKVGVYNILKYLLPNKSQFRCEIHMYTCMKAHCLHQFDKVLPLEPHLFEKKKAGTRTPGIGLPGLVVPGATSNSSLAIACYKKRPSGHCSPKILGKKNPGKSLSRELDHVIARYPKWYTNMANGIS